MVVFPVALYGWNTGQQRRDTNRHCTQWKCEWSDGHWGSRGWTIWWTKTSERPSKSPHFQTKWEKWGCDGTDMWSELVQNPSWGEHLHSAQTAGGPKADEKSNGLTACMKTCKLKAYAPPMLQIGLSGGRNAKLWPHDMTGIMQRTIRDCSLNIVYKMVEEYMKC